MVFSSVIFIFVFLPFIIFTNYILKVEYRNTFLLLMSLLFYAFGERKFVFIMVLSILINYFSGIIIDYANKNNYKKFKLISFISAIILNLGLLFYYKYFDFFISGVNKITGMNLPLLQIVLPIGISFFTFQGMSYVIDLYNKKVDVQKNFINLALYISLFPQLIAGPIVRYIDVNEQIKKRSVDTQKFTQGIRRFSIGLGKKVLISNQVGLVVDKIFALDPVLNINSQIAWLGAICYTFQIYFDFSGYSDMAIGLGKMFGFDFLENFNFPYISKSITEFWRRWHISLSSWFRDYLYIPLGGNRKGELRTYINLIIVFFVTGLWHGASFVFIIWGLWHGFFLILEKLFKKSKIEFKVPSALKYIITMAIVIIGWVLFRSKDLGYALNYLKTMFSFFHSGNELLFDVTYFLNYRILLVLVLSVICSLPIGRILKDKIKSKVLVEAVYSMYSILVLIVSMGFLMISTYNPFIYFRF